MSQRSMSLSLSQGFIRKTESTLAISVRWSFRMTQTFAQPLEGWGVVIGKVLYRKSLLAGKLVPIGCLWPQSGCSANTGTTPRLPTADTRMHTLSCWRFVASPALLPSRSPTVTITGTGKVGIRCLLDLSGFLGLVGACRLTAFTQS